MKPLMILTTTMILFAGTVVANTETSLTPPTKEARELKRFTPAYNDVLASVCGGAGLSVGAVASTGVGIPVAVVAATLCWIAVDDYLWHKLGNEHDG